jgi:hypothetical protein
MIWFLVLQLAIPNPRLTPGVTRPGFTKTVICATAWGRDVRHVTVGMKKTVAQRYGLTWPVKTRVEWDHLIPRELGGADNINNLWPQPWHEARTIKDLEENRYHRLLCAGQITLAAAQEHFRRWGQR